MRPVTILVALVVGLSVLVLFAGGGTATTPTKPAEVVEQNNPAFEPYQRNLEIAGCFGLVVPDGKRLVLEYIAARQLMFADYVRVATTASGNTAYYEWPLENSRMAAAVRLYADPLSTVEVCGGAGGGIGQIALSGYLVTLATK